MSPAACFGRTKRCGRAALPTGRLTNLRDAALGPLQSPPERASCRTSCTEYQRRNAVPPLTPFTRKPPTATLIVESSVCSCLSASARRRNSWAGHSSASGPVVSGAFPTMRRRTVSSRSAGGVFRPNRATNPLLPGDASLSGQSCLATVEQRLSLALGRVVRPDLDGRILIFTSSGGRMGPERRRRC